MRVVTENFLCCGFFWYVIANFDCSLCKMVLLCAAECGDYVVEDYPDHTYLSTYKFVPNQDHELERRIMENHKKHA